MSQDNLILFYNLDEKVKWVTDFAESDKNIAFIAEFDE